jgi:hypothetical protein
LNHEDAAPCDFSERAVQHAGSVREVGKLMQWIFEDLKPEAVYFTEQDGERTATLVINIANPSEIPKFAEPFFLKFNARCLFRAVMSHNDLQNAGLEALGKKWA